jgi:hypothetical protein
MADEVFTRETITVTHVNVTDDDRDLARDFNRVARKALIKADTLLDFGPPDAQVAIIRGFMSAAAKLASLDSKTEMEVHRAAFSDLMQEMRNVDPAVPVVAADAIELTTLTHAPLPEAPAQPAHDQDHLPGNEEVRPRPRGPRSRDR